MCGGAFLPKGSLAGKWGQPLVDINEGFPKPATEDTQKCVRSDPACQAVASSARPQAVSGPLRVGRKLTSLFLSPSSRTISTSELGPEAQGCLSQGLQGLPHAIF